MTHDFYCALCWQEFNDPREHTTGSWFGCERLDKPCRGDIRKAEGRQAQRRIPSDPTPMLNLEAGEPLNIQ